MPSYYLNALKQVT